MGLAPGSRLAHYQVLAPLGAGAMGEVWRARDTRLGREVAIKVLPEHFGADEERLRRFEREARTLASLNHPNVAQIFGVDQVGDMCFLVLELVPGESLKERLQRGPLPLGEALDVCRQIAEGLEAAHEAGVIHRDLKPANVLLTPEGKIKVLDFGLAKPASGSQHGSPADSVLSTEPGRMLGTPTYMAPEQARGKPIDKRVDIWAFGCVLYECLSAARAFGGKSLYDVLVRGARARARLDEAARGDAGARARAPPFRAREGPAPAPARHRRRADLARGGSCRGAVSELRRATGAARARRAAPRPARDRLRDPLVALGKAGECRAALASRVAWNRLLRRERGRDLAPTGCGSSTRGCRRCCPCSCAG